MSVSHKGSYFHSNSDSGSDSRSKPASHVLRPVRVHRQFTHPYLPVAGVQGHFDTRVSAYPGTKALHSRACNTCRPFLHLCHRTVSVCFLLHLGSVSGYIQVQSSVQGICNSSYSRRISACSAPILDKHRDIWLACRDVKGDTKKTHSDDTDMTL